MLLQCVTVCVLLQCVTVCVNSVHAAFEKRLTLDLRWISVNMRYVCCSVLQCVAVCCSVLQRVAACCSVLQCVAACCSAISGGYLYICALVEYLCVVMQYVCV